MEARTSGKHHRLIGAATAAIIAAISLAAASTAAADTFKVTNTGDPGAGSLRQAIRDANAHPGADTIKFADGVGGTIKMTQGEYSIQSNLEVQGPGSQKLTLSAQHNGRVFVISEGSKATISGMTISDGTVFGEEGHSGDAGGSISGGGILSRGDLTLDGVEVSGNRAEGGSGGNGTRFHSGGPGGNAYGGGVFSSGNLVVKDSFIAANAAQGSFGGDAPGTITLHAGEGGTGWGGGIYVNGPKADLTIRHSLIEGNKATGGEGGRDNASGSRGRRGGEGNGGGIEFSGGHALIDGATIEVNRVKGGPGPYGGHASGGGIRADRPLELSKSTVRGNDVQGGDGDEEARPQFDRGGGIMSRQGRLLVSRSTISGNSVAAGKRTNDSSIIAGGGIATFEAGILDVQTSTIAGNSSPVGGGIDIRDPGSSSSVIFATLAGNQTTGGAASGANFARTDSGPTSFKSAIVAQPRGGAGNCNVAVTSNGYNLEQGNSCGFTQATDKRNTNPLLDDLGMNGGPTKTMAIPRSSPAIDQGVGADGDQRGMQRPVLFDIPRPPGGDGSDIGAFELQRAR
jgi:hypothetical protein